jgi:hypothetical protein
MYNLHPIVELTHFSTLALKAFFTEGERLSAKVLHAVSAKRALVRIKGVDIELSTQIPLLSNQRLLLRVAEVEEGYVRFEVIDRMVKKSKLATLRALYKQKAHFWKEAYDELLSPLYKELPFALHPLKTDAGKLKETLLLLHPKNPRLQSQLQKSVGEEKSRELMVALQMLWLGGFISGSLANVLPLDWQEVQESSIVIKRLKKQDAYYCRVKLRFESQDRVAATFILHKSYLNLYLAVEDAEFREAVEKDCEELKKVLSGGKVAVNVFVKEYNEDDESHLVGEHFIQRKA